LRRAITTAAAVTVVATLGLIVYVLVVPARTAPALRWYLLFAGTLGVITAVRVITARYPVLWKSSADIGREQSERDDLPQRLRAIDRLVARAGWDAAGFELELRPILRAVAAQRLATYRTIDMDADSATARAVLGERVWALLTPVNLEAAREARGIAAADLRATVETLEELGASADA
jgi:hypothetical protein